MIAIVTAGGEIEPDQPLYETTHGGLKAMIDIHGKPMLQWVLDALAASTSIDRVVVVGLPPETNLDCALPLHLLPNQGNMISNIRSAAEEITRIDPHATHALLTSCDIPGLRGEMVDWLVCQIKAFDQDIYFTLVERDTMQSAFPGSKRTYTHLKDLQVCTGDLHCIRLGAAVEDRPLWQQLINARKRPMRQASLLGYDILFFMMLRRLSLQDAEATVCKRLGIQGQALLSPYPEIGMDVDKPFQLEIMRDYLSSRHERHAANL